MQERRLVYRREELQKQSYEGLARYLAQGLLDPASHDQIVALLRLGEQRADLQKALAEIETGRSRLYAAQEQIRNNLAALSSEGKEGALRAGFVDRLEASEADLAALADRESNLQAELKHLEETIQQHLAGLNAA